MQHVFDTHHTMHFSDCNVCRYMCVHVMFVWLDVCMCGIVFITRTFTQLQHRTYTGVYAHIREWWNISWKILAKRACIFRTKSTKLTCPSLNSVLYAGFAGKYSMYTHCNALQYELYEPRLLVHVRFAKRFDLHTGDKSIGKKLHLLGHWTRVIAIVCDGTRGVLIGAINILFNWQRVHAQQNNVA